MKAAFSLSLSLCDSEVLREIHSHLLHLPICSQEVTKLSCLDHGSITSKSWAVKRLQYPRLLHAKPLDTLISLSDIDLYQKTILNFLLGKANKKKFIPKNSRIGKRTMPVPIDLHWILYNGSEWVLPRFGYKHLNKV